MSVRRQLPEQFVNVVAVNNTEEHIPDENIGQTEDEPGPDGDAKQSCRSQGSGDQFSQMPLQWNEC